MHDHTGKLFSINILGTMTWLVESTNLLGFIGAVMAVMAGVMLVCIRWADFVASKPVQAFLAWRRERDDGDA